MREVSKLLTGGTSCRSLLQGSSSTSTSETQDSWQGVSAEPSSGGSKELPTPSWIQKGTAGGPYSCSPLENSLDASQRDSMHDKMQELPVPVPELQKGSPAQQRPDSRRAASQLAGSQSNLGIIPDSQSPADPAQQGYSTHQQDSLDLVHSQPLISMPSSAGHGSDLQQPLPAIPDSSEEVRRSNKSPVAAEMLSAHPDSQGRPSVQALPEVLPQEITDTSEEVQRSNEDPKQAAVLTIASWPALSTQTKSVAPTKESDQRLDVQPHKFGQPIEEPKRAVDSDGPQPSVLVPAQQPQDDNSDFEQDSEGLSRHNSLGQSRQQSDNSYEHSGSLTLLQKSDLPQAGADSAAPQPAPGKETRGPFDRQQSPVATGGQTALLSFQHDEVAVSPHVGVDGIHSPRPSASGEDFFEALSEAEEGSPESLAAGMQTEGEHVQSLLSSENPSKPGAAESAPQAADGKAAGPSQTHLENQGTSAAAVQSPKTIAKAQAQRHGSQGNASLAAPTPFAIRTVSLLMQLDH